VGVVVWSVVVDVVVVVEVWHESAWFSQQQRKSPNKYILDTRQLLTQVTVIVVSMQLQSVLRKLPPRLLQLSQMLLVFVVEGVVAVGTVVVGLVVVPCLALMVFMVCRPYTMSKARGTIVTVSGG
jgi:hypothetical protein